VHDGRRLIPKGRAASIFGHVRLIGMTPSEAVIVAAGLLAGGVGALSFWLIARTLPSIEAGLGLLQSS
jgi:hypothetical protein